MENFEKLDIPGALLTGIYDHGQSSLKAKLDLFALENQTLFEYIKSLSKEIEVVQAKKLKGNDFAPRSIEESTEIGDLESAFMVMYKFYRKIPKVSAALEELAASDRRLMISLADRKQDYQRLKRQHQAVMNDPKLKEQIAELDELKLEVEKEEERLAALTKENEDICAQVAEKEQNKQNLLEEEKRQLAEVESQITKVETYLANNEEELLAAEIADLELQLSKLKSNDYDDFSSEYSSNSMDYSPAAPVFEKLTTDLQSLFKNPNDFPTSMSPISTKLVKIQKTLSLGKHAHFDSQVKSAAAVKKARVGKRSSGSNDRPKSPVPVLLTSKFQQNLAKALDKKATPVAPSPIVISPPSDEKQPIENVLRIECLTKLPTMVRSTVESSEPDQSKVPYMPRSLDREYGTPKKQVKESVEERNAQQTSTNVLLPGENRIENMSISETTEDEQSAGTSEKESPMEDDYNDEIFDGKLSRQGSLMSSTDSVLNLDVSEDVQNTSWNLSGDENAGNLFMDFGSVNSEDFFGADQSSVDKSNDGFLF